MWRLGIVFRAKKWRLLIDTFLKQLKKQVKQYLKHRVYYFIIIIIIIIIIIFSFL